MREIVPGTGWLSGRVFGPPGRETVCSCQSPLLHHLVDSPTRPSVNTQIYHTPLMMSHSRERRGALRRLCFDHVLAIIG